jgi:DNA-binding CsgD family transcriptional regulator
MYCVAGEIASRSAYSRNFLGFGFPLGYIEEITQADGTVRSPLFEQWRREYRPQLFDPQTNDVDPRWRAVFDKYGLGNIISHGVLDATGAIGSYFKMIRIPERPDVRHAWLLKFLVPHMHEALMRVLRARQPDTQTGDPGPAVKLTEREREVLLWVQQGKNSREVGGILGISNKTVRNHVQNVLAKLGAGNRAQAVAKAMRLNLLSAK